MTESPIRLVALCASCLRMVEAELKGAAAGTGQPGVEAALERVQQLRPLVELIELTGSRGDEGDDDGRDA